MGKHKDGKKHKKSSQFAIRVDKVERDAFVSLCESLDTSAAREIRRFMRDWVAANTPKPADEPEATAPHAEASAAAALEMPTVQPDEATIVPEGHASSAGMGENEVKATKPRRKAASKLR